MTTSRARTPCVTTIQPPAVRMKHRPPPRKRIPGSYNRTPPVFQPTKPNTPTATATTSLRCSQLNPNLPDFLGYHLAGVPVQDRCGAPSLPRRGLRRREARPRGRAAAGVRRFVQSLAQLELHVPAIAFVVVGGGGGQIEKLANIIRRCRRGGKETIRARRGGKRREIEKTPTITSTKGAGELGKGREGSGCGVGGHERTSGSRERERERSREREGESEGER